MLLVVIFIFFPTVVFRPSSSEVCCTSKDRDAAGSTGMPLLFYLPRYCLLGVEDSICCLAGENQPVKEYLGSLDVLNVPRNRCF